MATCTASRAPSPCSTDRPQPERSFAARSRNRLAKRKEARRAVAQSNERCHGTPPKNARVGELRAERNHCNEQTDSGTERPPQVAASVLNRPPAGGRVQWLIQQDMPRACRQIRVPLIGVPRAATRGRSQRLDKRRALHTC